MTYVIIVCAFSARERKCLQEVRNGVRRLGFSEGMAFLIKYIKDGAFVATEPCAGTLDEATRSATAGVKMHGAEVAAVMDEKDLDGAPKALVTSG